MKSTDFTREQTVTENPVSELPKEAQSMLASDFEKLAAEAMKVAESLHKHNKKAYNSHWEELSYLVLRVQRQVAQFKK